MFSFIGEWGNSSCPLMPVSNCSVLVLSLYHVYLCMTTWSSIPSSFLSQHAYFPSEVCNWYPITCILQLPVSLASLYLQLEPGALEWECCGLDLGARTNLGRIGDKERLNYLRVQRGTFQSGCFLLPFTTSYSQFHQYLFWGDTSWPDLKWSIKLTRLLGTFPFHSHYNIITYIFSYYWIK